MNNFIFENKTKVYFGKGGVKEYLGCLLKKYGKTVMLAYGGGSIKHNGVYDEVTGILNAAGKTVVEFSGIMPNPTYAKVQEGAKLAREKGVDLILRSAAARCPTAARLSLHRRSWTRTFGTWRWSSTPSPASSFRWGRL